MEPLLLHFPSFGSSQKRARGRRVIASSLVNFWDGCVVATLPGIQSRIFYLLHWSKKPTKPVQPVSQRARWENMVGCRLQKR